MLLVTSKIKALAKANGKRVSQEFLDAMSQRVEQHVLRACKTHNGGKVTLDLAVFCYTK